MSNQLQRMEQLQENCMELSEHLEQARISQMQHLAEIQRLRDAIRERRLDEIDRLKAELAEAGEAVKRYERAADTWEGLYNDLRRELVEVREDAHGQMADAVNSERKAERARCIAAIEASCMICPECIVEAVKVIEADA